MLGTLLFLTLTLNVVAAFANHVAGISFWSCIGTHLLACLLAFVCSYLILMSEKALLENEKTHWND